jgi:hypothetical protein
VKAPVSLDPGSSVEGRGVRLLFAALVALIAVPYLLFDFPPHQDFPGHAAMLAIRERLPESAFLQQYFERGSVVGPYAVFLGLGQVLAPVVGPEGALRIVGAVANAALPCLLLLARRWVHGGAWWGAGFFGLCLSLGFLTAQGLISFLFGLSAFALAFSRWVTLLVPSGRPAPALAWQVVALSTATFFAHGFAFLLLLLCAGLTLVIDRPGLRRLARSWVFLPGLVIMALIYLRDRGVYPPDVSVGLVQYRPDWAKLQMLFLPTTFSRLGVDVVAGGVIWLLLGAAVLATLRKHAGAEPPSNGQRAAVLLARTAVLLFVLALLAPKRFDFFGSLDIRLATAALLVAMLAISPTVAQARLTVALRIVPPILGSAMVVTLLVAAAIFQREAAAGEPVLRRIPDHARVLYLPVQPYSRVWAAMPFFHFEKRLLFDRDVLVGNVWLHQGTALRPTSRGLGPLTVTPVATADGEVPWADYDLRPWEYVLVRNARPDAPRDAPAVLLLLASRGGMHLYRNGESTTTGPPSGAR